MSSEAQQVMANALAAWNEFGERFVSFADGHSTL